MAGEFLALTPLMRDGLDPIEDLRRMRETQPVVRLQIPFGPAAWVVTRYEDVRAVLADADRFSNDFSNLADMESAEIFRQLDPGGLGFRDPPEHTRLRKMMTAEFTMHRLRRLTAFIQSTVDARLDAIEAAGPGADLVASFARQIPSQVVFELLGVPEDRREELHQISNGRFEFSGDPQTSFQAVQESLTYLADVIARQRENPGSGLLGMLIRDHGDEIDDWELAGLADGLITGGHDTSVSMLALGALVLMQAPSHAQAMCVSDAAAAALVEELLRYLTVVQVAFPRFARVDTVLNGQHIAAGEIVLCSLSAANRDESFVGKPDCVDGSQATASHLAFGHGIHHCVGAQLARFELTVALPALFRRFPGLRPAIPAEELEFRPFSVVYGLERLPVTW